jgi:hypothetical protein
MTKIPYLFILLVLAVMSPALAAASAPGNTVTFDSIQITRIVPDQAARGERIVISQVLVNTGTGSRTVGMTQVLSPEADLDPALVKTTMVSHAGEGRTCFGANCSRSPLPGSFSEYTTTASFYQWSVTLGPGEKKDISYWLAPRSPGQYLIRPASVMIGGKEYFLPAESVQVGCSSGHACDPLKGENYLTCPQNCANASADNICNPGADGQCDPDCTAGVDPDCSTKKPATPLPPGIGVVAVIAGGAAWLLGRKNRQG